MLALPSLKLAWMCMAMLTGPAGGQARDARGPARRGGDSQPADARPDAAARRQAEQAAAAQRFRHTSSMRHHASSPLRLLNRRLFTGGSVRCDWASG